MTVVEQGRLLPAGTRLQELYIEFPRIDHPVQIFDGVKTMGPDLLEQRVVSDEYSGVVPDHRQYARLREQEIVSVVDNRFKKSRGIPGASRGRFHEPL